MTARFANPLCALSLLAGMSVPLSAGLVTAGFGDGAGTASVDQYPGIAGSGWSGAWTTGNLPSGGITADLQSTPPIGTGGNHLRMAVSSTNADVGIGRAFVNSNGTSGVDGTKTVTFKFDVRLDSANSGFSSSTGDYLTIHNNTGLVSASGTRHGSSASSAERARNGRCTMETATARHSARPACKQRNARCPGNDLFFRRRGGSREPQLYHDDFQRHQ